MINPSYIFALYTAGHGPNSIRAIGQVKRLLEKELHGAYELNIVDILKDPLHAQSYGVMAAPTLVRIVPKPTRRIVGDLDDSDSVMEQLDLVPAGRANQDA